jgi:methyl-accepting chemotaxis protein
MNWLNDINVGTKLTLSFLFLISLTAISALVSLDGTKEMNNEVEHADSLNRIVKHIKDVRIAEKNFDLRGDEKYLDQIDELLISIDKLVIIVTNSGLYDNVALLKIVENLNGYRDALTDYVKEERRLESLNDDMRQTARQVEDTLITIRQSHKQELRSIINSMQTSHIYEAVSVADDANRLIKLMYEARQAEKNLMLSGDFNYADNVNALIASMHDLTKEAFGDKNESVDNTNKLIDKYGNEFREYVYTLKQRDETTTRLLENARQVQESAEYIRTEAKQLLVASGDEVINVTLSITMISLIVGCVISFVMTQQIVSPLKIAVDTINKIAQGDLDANVSTNRKDELGQLLTAMGMMAKRLGTMIGEISDNISIIASSSEQLSALTIQTSQGVTNQKEDIVQVATAMTEMSSSAQEVSIKAELTLESANLAKTEADRGNDLVIATVEGMDVLSQIIDESEQAIQSVKGESENIVSILDTIKNISEQTNLLALNAAIEAARAGEYGRGFSVVADEVRSLAQKTQNSTVEIEKMIACLKFSADSAVDRMLKSKEQVEVMVNETENVKTSLDSITQEINAITEMNAQVSQAVNEQRTVAEEVSVRTNTIQDVADQTSESSLQTSKASSELARVGENLRDLSGAFNQVKVM